MAITSPPARVNRGNSRPPAVATSARPPARTIASVISSVPRSTPPWSRLGTTCNTVRGRVSAGPGSRSA
jgi:hypothetical protein